MFTDDRITTAMVKALFAEEIAALDGKVSDTFDDGERLFVRSILPGVEEVRAKDCVEGGVALRMSGGEAWVHPYVFRQVCSNGAIMARAIETRHVADVDVRGPEEVLPELREAIQACASREAFTVAAQQMRSAQDARVDLAISFLPLLSRFPTSLVTQIMGRFLNVRDRSAFDMANAMTATARDMSDPELRWRLEELGGGVFAGRKPRFPRHDGRVAHRREDAVAASSTASV
jgi:hypothetical protein